MTKNQGHLSSSHGRKIIWPRNDVWAEETLYVLTQATAVRVPAGQGRVGLTELVRSCFLDWIDPTVTDALIRTLFAKNMKGFYYTGENVAFVK